MSGSVQEKEWKYLRSIEPHLLSKLCKRINEQAADIANSEKFGNEHAKYLELFKHIQASDRIIADCFNDWRRSDILWRLPLLRRHGLLTDEHISNLSDESRKVIGSYEGGSGAKGGSGARH